MLTREDQDDLVGLKWNWEGAYEFKITDGFWFATSMADPSTVLSADTAEELRVMVRRNYLNAPRGAGAGRVPVTDYLPERMST